MIRLAVSTQYRLVTNGHTDKWTPVKAYTALSQRCAVKQ